MYSLTGDEVFAFSVCSFCKSPPSVRLEEGFLPAGLCKLLEIKDYIISYHSSVVLSVSCKCEDDLTGSLHLSFAQVILHLICRHKIFKCTEVKHNKLMTLYNMCFTCKQQLVYILSSSQEVNVFISKM